MPLDITNPFNVKVDHNFAKIGDAIGFFPKAWRAAKKYSVNNTLPIAAVNAWLQFSLAYIAAVMITSNDVSFITNIFNSQTMPAYVLASIILGTILLTSLAIKYINKQEIKDKRSKDSDSPIDEKIGGGHSDGINEIAQNALTIEIVPDLSDLVDKKQGFSIVLPISGKQGEILENERQENRNKIILLIVPYVLSNLIVVSALAKFGFANIQGWGWVPIVVSIFAIVGIYMALKNNEINNVHNVAKKFDNLDILLPWRKGSVVSVMENKFKIKEKDDLQSQALRLFDKHLTDLINRVCYLLDNSLLKPSNVNIQETLDGMEKDVKTLLDNLEESIKQNVDGVEATANGAIIQCLENIDKSVDELCKGVGKDVQKKLDKISIEDSVNNISRLAETLEDRISRLKPGARMGLAGAVFADARLPNASGGRENDQLPQDEQASSDEEPDAQRVGWAERVKEIGQLKKKIKELEKALEKEKNNQNQSENGVSSEASSTTSNDVPRDEEKILDEKLAQLEKKERIEEKREKIKNLEEARPKQKEINEWQKSINGNPSEFLYYLLESIKLEKKDDKEKKVGEATLHNFNNKIIIHWRDGSQTICHINKQGDLPSTKFDFVDKNIHAAFKVACAG